MLFSSNEVEAELRRQPIYLVSSDDGSPAEDLNMYVSLSINGQDFQTSTNRITALEGQPGSYYLQLTQAEVAAAGTIRFIINVSGIRKFDVTSTVVGWATSSSPAFGDIPVDHNWGGSDSLRFVDAKDIPISGADIIAYTLDDYLAGRTASDYVQGRTKTDVNGRWSSPIMLFPGEYRLVFSSRAKYRTALEDISVN